jgi:hypothetical protein
MNRDYIPENVISHKMNASAEGHQTIDPLSKMISNFLGSVNRGTVTIDIDKHHVLTLMVNPEDTNKISLDFGQKFMEMFLEAFTEMTFSKTRNIHE